MSLWEYANPTKFMRLSGAVLPWVSVLAGLSVVSGLIWGFFLTPEDFKQGSTVKIIFIHVPAAMLAINAWFMMLVASLIWVIRRHHVSALAARAAAPVGFVMTLIALITGAVWGQPMWGTWWAWDPRLTSFLILALFYLGYMALWEAVENADTAADLTSVLCLVGTVFAILSRYAVNFWNQGLHQGASVGRVDAVTGADTAEKVSNVYFYPLSLSILGFFLLFIALVLLRTRTEIRLRRSSALLARERIG
ncbi:heme ABC transporter permease [Halocynthiibacter sp.]|uniref:heme ABC transporter permease n=1 Tax=Halocynthiibacter sp. TaxID=1979210 RepID=UPI003C562818